MYVCNLSYTEAALDADRRYRRGERQSWCPLCRLWRWPDEGCCGVPRLSGKEFRAVVREARKDGTL